MSSHSKPNHLSRMSVIGLLVGALLLLQPNVDAYANPANPPLGRAPVLGACGVFTAEKKVLYKYRQSKYDTLYCGNNNYGFRHIRTNHRADFQSYATLTGLQWWDLMHWAIYYNYKDPQRVLSAGNGKTCRSRTLTLKSINGSTSSKIFRVISGSNGVISAYPSKTHCK